MSSSVTSWTAARQASLYFTISWSCSDPGPLSWWCYLTISSSATPLSFCLKSFPASGSFPMSQLFTSGGQSIGVSTSASVLPMNRQGWFPLGLTGLISLYSRGPQDSSPALQCESTSSSALGLLYGPTLTSIHDYWKNHGWDYTDLHWQSDVSTF